MPSLAFTQKCQGMDRRLCRFTLPFRLRKERTTYLKCNSFYAPGTTLREAFFRTGF